MIILVESFKSKITYNHPTPSPTCNFAILQKKSISFKHKKYVLKVPETILMIKNNCWSKGENNSKQVITDRTTCLTTASVQASLGLNYYQKQINFFYNDFGRRVIWSNVQMLILPIILIVFVTPGMLSNVTNHILISISFFFSPKEFC